MKNDNDKWLLTQSNVCWAEFRVHIMEGNVRDFLNKMRIFNSLDEQSKKKLTINLKKTVKNYTQFSFFKKISKILI